MGITSHSDRVTLKSHPIGLELDRNWPRIMSLRRLDTDGSLIGSSPDTPFRLRINQSSYGPADLEVEATFDTTLAVYRLTEAISGIVVEVTLQLDAAAECVVIKLTVAGEPSPGFVKQIGLPGSWLVSGRDEASDYYYGPGSSRKNWFASWCAGAYGLSGSDFGPVGGGTPSGFKHHANYACIWNDKISVTVATSRRTSPLVVELQSGAGALPERGAFYRIGLNDFPVFFQNRRAAPAEARIAILGDYNGNGKIDWCDAAGWLGDLGRAKVPDPFLYRENLVYKLYLDNIAYETPARTFAQCLEVIELIHRVSDGLKQIVYLVGWQDRGHDTAYPAMGPVNERCGGRTGLQSLIETAALLNCVVSVHTNFDDAYQGNPGFDPAVLSSDPDGRLHLWFTNHEVGNRPVFSINHTRANETGYHRKQLDELLGNVSITKSVHLDAHRAHNTVWNSDGTVLDVECEAQFGIEPLRSLFAKQGIDITNEHVGFGPHGGSIWGWMGCSHTEAFQTLMAHGLVGRHSRPGPEGEGLGRDFILGEHDKPDWNKVVENFYTHWMYSQLIARKSMLDYSVGDWNEGVEAWYEDDTHVISGRGGAAPTVLRASYEGIPIARGSHRFLPWRDDQIFLYAHTDSVQSWTLPVSWEGRHISVEIQRPGGWIPGPIPFVKGLSFTLNAEAQVPYRITLG